MNPHQRLCKTCAYFRPVGGTGDCARQWHSLLTGKPDDRCPLPYWHAIRDYCGPQLQGWEPTAPASPWPMPIHNPDNLTPEQFGDPAVWRPATPGELRTVEVEFWVQNKWVMAESAPMWAKFAEYPIHTYRIRRDVRDWPKGGEK